MTDVHAHEDKVFSFVSGQRGETLDAGSPPLVGESWKRCVTSYRLDPADRRRPRILTATELKDFREPMEAFVRIARHEVDVLFRDVAEADLVVLLTDAHGVTVEYRGAPERASDLKRAGLYLGSVWSEEAEGTNGVGTCIATGRPLTIFQGEHFRTRNSGLTCTVAPVLDPRGRLLAVLDVSSMRPTSRASQALALAMVRDCARRLEKKYLLNRYAGQWIARLSTQPDDTDLLQEYLLVLDEHGTILAADSDAFRRWQPAGAPPLMGRAISDLVQSDADSICSPHTAEGGTLASRLADDAEPVFVRSRAPLQTSRSRSRPMVPAGCGQRQRTAEPSLALNAMRLNQLTRAIERAIPILISGETGTGKELLARRLHERSRRRGPFVAVNCAALPESLIESELFGYRAGAFTGAHKGGARGRIREAHGGVLFLDEIGDMPQALQSRLLRVLANREVHPLGGGAPVAVDLTVICATHRRLGRLVASGAFREDLYYRINGLAVELPALRERPDRRALIVELLEAEADAVCQPARIDPEALALLDAYRWPGNVRQLRHVLQVALLVADGGTIAPQHLPGDVLHDTYVPAAARETAAPASGHPASALEQTIQALTRRHWCVARAARDLGISRSTLHRRMKRHGITPPNKR